MSEAREPGFEKRRRRRRLRGRRPAFMKRVGDPPTSFAHAEPRKASRLPAATSLVSTLRPFVALSDYLLLRLVEETRSRGGAVAIARATGFSKSHLSNVLSRQCPLGAALTLALAEMWGLRFEAPGSPLAMEAP